MISTSIDTTPHHTTTLKMRGHIFLRKIVKTSNFCPIIAMNFFISSFLLIFQGLLKVSP